MTDAIVITGADGVVTTTRAELEAFGDLVADVLRDAWREVSNRETGNGQATRMMGVAHIQSRGRAEGREGAPPLR